MATLRTDAGSRARRRWFLMIAALLIGFGIAGRPAPVLADEAPGAVTRTHSAHQGVAVITVVRARDLMSAADRQAYRQAMHQAGDEAARLRIREQVIGILRERAAQHGVVMVIETRAMHSGLRRGENEPVRPPMAP